MYNNSYLQPIQQVIEDVVARQRILQLYQQSLATGQKAADIITFHVEPLLENVYRVQQTDDSLSETLELFSSLKVALDEHKTQWDAGRRDDVKLSEKQTENLSDILKGYEILSEAVFAYYDFVNRHMLHLQQMPAKTSRERLHWNLTFLYPDVPKERAFPNKLLEQSLPKDSRGYVQAPLKYRLPSNSQMSPCNSSNHMPHDSGAHTLGSMPWTVNNRQEGDEKTVFKKLRSQ